MPVISLLSLDQASNCNLQSWTYELLCRASEKSDRKRCALAMLGGNQVTLSTEPETNQGPDGQPTVGVTDFLAFIRGPRVVLDRNFCNPLAQPAQLRSNFRAKLEASTFQLKLLQHGSPKHFVARGFIVNAAPIKKIGQMSPHARSSQKHSS